MIFSGIEVVVVSSVVVVASVAKTVVVKGDDFLLLFLLEVKPSVVRGRISGLVVMIVTVVLPVLTTEYVDCTETPSNFCVTLLKYKKSVVVSRGVVVGLTVDSILDDNAGIRVL